MHDLLELLHTNFELEKQLKSLSKKGKCINQVLYGYISCKDLFVFNIWECVAFIYFHSNLTAHFIQRFTMLIDQYTDSPVWSQLEPYTPLCVTQSLHQSQSLNTVCELLILYDSLRFHYIEQTECDVNMSHKFNKKAIINILFHKRF